jgi:hypothetical protein
MDGLADVTGGVNPVLTRLMADYANAKTQYAATRIFPWVQSDQDVGTVYADDAGNGLRYEDVEWGRKRQATEVDFRLGEATFRAHPRAYKTLVLDSDKRNFMGPLSLERYIARKLMDKFLVAREVKAEDKLRGSSAIQSEAADNAWNAASLDPIKDFADASDKIVKAVAMLPNTILIPPAVWSSRFMRNTTNTVGKVMRDQLGYVLQMTGDNITPSLVAKWFGVENCIVPQCVKGGQETTSDEGTGLAAGAFIWSDTTVVYVMYQDPNPSVGSPSYGIAPGPQDVRADMPNASWDPPGEWHRASSILVEHELSAKACCKITSV